MQIRRRYLIFSLSVPVQCIFIGLQAPHMPEPLDPRTSMFYTNDAYGRLFDCEYFLSYFGFVFVFSDFLYFFSLYSSNLLASNNAKFSVLFES